ncbi:glycosyltransferase family 4 protein [Desulfurivibrio sp. D14AmB]|uniref:glycosyltransferase family 4 protein n=1 Tax=Desulfurivibrio sp. D14AmB TaxID=3374370 RepID=UPI00376F1644
MVAGKIVVAQVLPELQSGGVERDTLELAGYLAQRGHQSLVISGGGRLVSRLEAEGSEHITMNLGRKSPSSLTFIPPLRRLLRQRRVDILHLRSRMPAWIAYLAWKSLPAGRRPHLVTTFHGFYSINSYSAIMTRGEKVIAVSRAIADHIQQHYQVPKQRIELIHDGVNTDTFHPGAVPPQRVAALRRQWQLPAAGPIIMLPGRITRLKGHDIFLRSLAQIKELPWLAICVGDLEDNPEYAGQLRQLSASLGLAQRVKFVGHCSEMPAALLLADLVVSATSTAAEAFGLTTVEAGAMGRAVVATAHGGSLETVLPGQTGWLVEPNNPTALAFALKEALGDPDRRQRLGAAAQEWINSNFTTARMCAKSLNLYQQLIR